MISIAWVQRLLGTPEGGPVNNCHFEITESLEHEKFTHRLWEKWDPGTLGGPITYTLEPVDGGTKLALMGVVEMPWGILGKIIEPLILRMGRKEFERSLENLKTRGKKEKGCGVTRITLPWRYVTRQAIV
jgi:hypothetical protein